MSRIEILTTAGKTQYIDIKQDLYRPDRIFINTNKFVSANVEEAVQIATILIDTIEEIKRDNTRSNHEPKRLS